MAEQASYLKNLKSESVVQKVINCLTDGMVSGELKPGDKLPTEPELAATLGVARTSVREATKILTYLGVLESRRSEGTFVANGFQESMIDPMVYGIILNKGEDFDSLMELRELTEVGILRLAIKKRSEEGLETIREKLDAFSDAVEQENLTAAFQADNDFHDAVSSLCQNDLVDKINRVVRVLTYAVRQTKGTLRLYRGNTLLSRQEVTFPAGYGRRSGIQRLLYLPQGEAGRHSAHQLGKQVRGQCLGVCAQI